MIRTAKIFGQFFLKDWFVHLKKTKDYLISYAFFLPIVYSFSWGYIISNSVFSSLNLPNAFALVGSISVIFITNAVPINLDFLFDIQSDRFIEYQISVLKPRWLILERILFSTTLLSCIMLILIAMCKIYLGSWFSLENLNMAKLIAIIFASSLWCSSYVIMAYSIMGNTSYISSWYRRCNFPMIIFGGLWMPWQTLYEYSTTFGYICLLNPLIYISEGLRSSIFGPENYISFWICFSTLIFIAIIFYIITLKAFKKLIDHP